MRVRSPDRGAVRPAQIEWQVETGFMVRDYDAAAHYAQQWSALPITRAPVCVLLTPALAAFA